MSDEIQITVVLHARLRTNAILVFDLILKSFVSPIISCYDLAAVALMEPQYQQRNKVAVVQQLVRV
jgi:hypothetical protein